MGRTLAGACLQLNEWVPMARIASEDEEFVVLPPSGDGLPRGDYLLMNPPFGRDLVQFIRNAIDRLAPNGRGVLLVPSGFLQPFGGEQRALCQQLLARGQIEAVIHLPRGRFEPRTKIRVHGLLIDKAGGHEVVRFVDGAKLVGANGDVQRLPTSEEISQASRAARALTLRQIEEGGWSLDEDAPGLAEPAWTDGPLGQALRAMGGVVPLSACAQIIPGYKVRSAELDGVRSSAADLPYIRIQDIRDGLVTAGAKYVRASSAARIPPQRILRPGDAVVSRSGTIGKAGGVDASLGPAVASGGLYLFRPDEQRLDPAWLLGYLRTRECQQWMQKRSRGSLILCVTVAICAGMQMPLPPLDVQRKALARSQTSGESFLQSLAAVLGVQ